MKLPLLFAAVVAGWFAVLPANATSATALPGVAGFIDDMVKRHHFKRRELQQIFAKVEYRPAVIEAMSRPATSRPWPDYRAVFVNPRRIRQGLEFWNKYPRTLRRAEQRYGVPQEIIVAIIGVETNYGENAGRFRTIDALSTLAFDYPRRAEFFRDELEQYLLLAREQRFDLSRVEGSYAGALGIPQFMPSSYRRHAVDFNGNRKIDLLHEPSDAIGSVANYLRNYGWISARSHGSHSGKRQPAPIAAQAQSCAEVNVGEDDLPRTLAAWSLLGVTPGMELGPDQTARLIYFTVGDSRECWLAFNNFDVITRYNNSDYYAMSVFQLAEALKEARNTGL